MNQFPPNLDPKIYNISSVVIGFALIQNFSAAEQNAIGNWFITVGQILENNSAWQQLIEQRKINQLLVVLFHYVGQGENVSRNVVFQFGCVREYGDIVTVLDSD